MELDIDLAQQATTYLRRFSNVEVFQGDAVQLLPQLIAREDARAGVKAAQNGRAVRFGGQDVG